ncbi:RimJ/RimL family protein N-acetyltransferase [Algoriphagus boseongensis]|uniref:RimJ/RimL family protein N-acetyltransferase n=1 Tax=Algoriphagus boseongensis TaxID=1442587 RepID=A0A4R6T6N9_9BACT|nr:GNAT family N-acetyltransferase [Algoriphagus boseongensis]TDQ18640.1 RimJ/RimL family protein N-acetyltransferase [Algoriphagus boseongensis]
MVPRDLILQNEKVLLRPMTRQDFPLLQKLTQDPERWIYFTQDLSKPEEFEIWASGHFSGERFQFTVIEKATGKVAGATAFGSFSPRDERLEIGWTWLGKDFQGTGINQEMKKLMLDYCFQQLKVKRVEIKTDVLNIPARKALLKLGAREEGVLRSHTLMTRGRRRDTIYYSFLEGEWV